MYLKFLAIGILLLLMSCQNTSEQKTEEKLDPNTHKVVVEEVKQSKTYTYLRVTEKDIEYWIAISKKDVQEEDVLYYNRSLEMKDFESKDLSQKFETIYFVDNISDKPIKQSANMMNSPRGNAQSILKDGISIDPVEDGITIAELFAKKDEYVGKSVKIRGQVVKYNSQIMGRNWVHIQDGTSYENNFDLTITTNDLVKPGDVVTFEGKITLNKDFGAGYAYAVLMEEGKQNSIPN
jgi:hypothetical protein